MRRLVRTFLRVLATNVEMGDALNNILDALSVNGSRNPTSAELQAAVRARSQDLTNRVLYHNCVMLVRSEARSPVQT